MTVWALIAAFNEAPSIAGVVSGVRPHVASVLVVDDGSTDGTAEVAASAGAAVIRHQANCGKGAAIRTGLATVLDTDATHVLLLDGDGQHEPADAPALIRPLAAEGRFRSRRAPVRSRIDAAVAYWTNRISSRVISRYSWERRSATPNRAIVLSRPTFDACGCPRGYEIETEMLIKAARRARLARVPISLRYEGAVSKLRPWRDTTRTCFLAVRYRFFPERLQ
jgi:glycosyltransferase involved in cell wall biosynthesis